MIATLLAWISAHMLTSALAALVPGAGLAALAVKYGGAVLSFLEGHRKEAVFFALSIAGAALYAWGAIGRHDRDGQIATLNHWIETACASAGSPYAGANGKAKPGALCQARVAQLAGEERNTAIQTATILAQAAKERDTKAARDAAQAETNSAAAKSAAASMEKANDAIGSDNQVGGGWFASLNGTGGLHAPAR